MVLSSLDEDLALLVAAARVGGDAVMPFFRAGHQVWEKEGGAGPVTEADYACDRVVREMIARERPDWGWLSEETADDPAARTSRARVAILDPIDGTRAFMAGEAHWCVALALAERGRPVAGVALFPALGRVYAARAGGGAFRDGERIHVSDRSDIKDARVLAGRGQLDGAGWPGGAPPVRRVFRAAMIHRFCVVAEGGAEAVVTLKPVWEWDAAAGVVIAAEAGAAATDSRGAELVFNAERPRFDGVIVAAPEPHAELMKLRRG